MLICTLTGADAIPSQPVKASAADVRAVANALRAETAAADGLHPSSDAAVSCSEEAAEAKDPGQSRWWENDFLPLPITERYPKPHKRPR